MLSYKNTESIVIGLYGEWGSGKSSVVNMVLEQVETRSETTDPSERAIVIKFNPWNYSDQNQLISQFFRSLSVALSRKDLGKDAADAGKQLETYSKFFAPLALALEPMSFTFFVATLIPKVMGSVGKAAKEWGDLKSKNLEDVRKALDALLAKQKRKLLIVIDDIDRLNNAEIRQIFQLVKALGDFPNTVYLLAMDRNVVINALAKVQEGPGNEYLEKIVQVPFQLPSISKTEVEKVLFDQLDALLAANPKVNWDQTYWGNVFQGGLRLYFNTIRDVTRYINALRFSYEMIADEVNPVDFLAITALQIFEPGVYAGIRDNADLFVGVFNAGLGRREAASEQARKRCDELIGRGMTIPKQHLQELLTRLFPSLDSIYSNVSYGDGSLLEWRQGKRICSPEKFEIFFRLAIPKNEIADAEINAAVDVASNEAAFAEMLFKYNASGKIIRLLERMEDITQKALPIQSVPTVFNVLMDLGDLFPEGEGGGWFERDTSMKVMRLLYQLSQRYESQADRFSLDRTAIEKAEQSIYTIVREVGLNGQEHGKHRVAGEQAEPEEKRRVGAVHLTELEKLAVEKIEKWASDGRLKKHPKLVSILFAWKRWASDGDEKVKDFVDNLIASDDGLVQLMVCFENKVFSRGMSDRVARVEYRINLKTVEEFVPIKSIEPRLRTIHSSSNFSNYAADEQRAVKTFLDTVDGKSSDW